MAHKWARRVALFWRTYNWRYLLVRILVNALTLLVTAVIVPGIGFHLGTPILSIVLVALLLGVFNAIVKPIAQVLTLQLIFVTYGLVVVLINGVILFLLAEFAPVHFYVNGFLAALFGGALMWISSVVLEGLFGLSLPVVPPEQAQLRQYVQMQERDKDMLAVLAGSDGIGAGEAQEPPEAER